ncbi:MAG: RNA-binding protein [Clostridia bacterium]|nr:RNA-binding protein [Clostridia bacterium]
MSAREYVMQLDGRHFLRMQSGEKRVELRLYDEKRSRLAPGDRIVFQRRDCPEQQLTAVVLALHRFDSFLALFSTPLLPICGFGALSAQEAAAEMRRYYPEEQERKYGVIGIEITLLDEGREIL